MGLDARALSPGMIERVMFAAAETRSFARAELAVEKIGGVSVSANTIQRVVGDVGSELAMRRDADTNGVGGLAQRPESPPELAVVECDGGRARTREPGQGAASTSLAKDGVRRRTPAWFGLRVRPSRTIRSRNRRIVSAIRNTRRKSRKRKRFRSPRRGPLSAPSDEVPAASDDLPSVERPRDDWRPRRLVRTVVSSMKSSRDFGRQMAKEAKQRRFFEAPAKAFLGDGLPWNWTIWKEHFGDFTPILDFIHPLSYLFLAAKAVHPSSEADGWSQYLAWMRGCWQGDVGQVLDELRAWQDKLGEPPVAAPDADPRKIVAGTVTYLENNRVRMEYPAYRKAGLPVTTAWMESLVKEVNYRVKGSEMFWNNPAGAEAILQVRAAALSDDDRLSHYLHSRPGCPFVRRPKLPKAPAEICKS